MRSLVGAKRVQRGSTCESKGRDLLQGDESHVSLRLDYRKHDPLKHPPERLVSSGVSVVAVVYSQSGAKTGCFAGAIGLCSTANPRVFRICKRIAWVGCHMCGGLHQSCNLCRESKDYSPFAGVEQHESSRSVGDMAWSRVHQEAEMLPEQELAQHQGEPGSLKAHQPKELRL